MKKHPPGHSERSEVHGDLVKQVIALGAIGGIVLNGCATFDTQSQADLEESNQNYQTDTLFPLQTLYLN